MFFSYNTGKVKSYKGMIILPVISFRNKNQKYELSLQEVSERATQRALSRFRSTPSPEDSPGLKRLEEKLKKVEKG